MLFTACNTTTGSFATQGTPSDVQRLKLSPAFTIKATFNYAYPLDGRPIQLTEPYYVEVRNDSLFSYLPYYGGASFIPYNGGKALNFDAPILRMEGETYSNNERTTYYIEVQTPEDRHLYQLDTYAKSSTVRLQVRSRQRDIIRFEGYIR